VRLSNWETWPLSAEQIRYAAADAYASLRVHEARCYHRFQQLAPSVMQNRTLGPCLAAIYTVPHFSNASCHFIVLVWGIAWMAGGSGSVVCVCNAT
jgi:hypothetical protein